MKGMVSNYKINLIEIRKWEDTSAFQTDLRQVFDFIRYSKDRGKLKDLIENNPEYKQLNEQAYDVIKEYAHVTELKVKAEGGKVNMCQALQEIIEEEREIARKEEREKMEKEREKMRQALQERGEEERKNLIGRGLQNGMSPERFVSLLGISLGEVLKVHESFLRQIT